MPPRRRRPPRAGALTELPPLKIVRSILLLQGAYYAIALVLIFFTTVVLGQPFNISLLLDWSSIRGDTTLGWTIGIVWLLVAFFTVIPILLLITRSKLVPDFALTIHLLHLIISTFYKRSLPSNLLWWAYQGASAFLMISLGVWGCRYREMQPISFGTLPPIKVNAVNDDLEAGQGHTRGGNGGRRAGDGGPSYEMVGMENGGTNADRP